MDKATAAKPVLNKVWWDKHKAKTLLKTGVGKSLLDFELAFDRAMKGTKPVEDEKVVQKAAADAKKVMIAARGKANKTLHAETITALTNMETMLDAEVKRSVERSKKAPPVPKQEDKGARDTAFTMNVAARVRERYNPPWLAKLDGWEIKLTLNPSISQALRSMPRGEFYFQLMSDEAQKIGFGSADTIAKYIKKIDDGTASATADQVDKARKNVQPFIDKEVAKAQQQMLLVPKKVWDMTPAAKTQYKDYRVDAAITVTKGVASVTLSAAALAGSHGASLALSIVGIVRGTTAIVKTLYDLSLEANTVGKQLMIDVSQLQKDYYDAAGKVNTQRQATQEITGTFLKSILGTDFPFLKTLPKVTANYELWDNKIAGAFLRGGEISSEITSALTGIEKLEADLKNADNATVRKVYNDLLKMRASLDTSLKAVTKVMVQVRTFREAGPTVKAQIDKLNDDNTALNKIIDVLVPAPTDIGLSAGGAALDFKSAETAFDTVKTAVTFATDIEGIGKDTLEAALGK